MSRFRYNRQVNPQAPFVYASVGGPAEGTLSQECPAQLDIAADLSVIPWQLAEDLQLDRLAWIPTEGKTG